jgi:hypothetical protein
MPVMLKGTPGYYAGQVVLEGTTFSYRELEDAELGAALEAMRAVNDLSAEVRASVREALTPGSEALDVLMAAGAGSLLKGKQATEKFYNALVVPGVVAWDIPNAECTPENVSRLPNAIKIKLGARIMQDSILADSEEQVFTTPGGASVRAGSPP